MLYRIYSNRVEALADYLADLCRQAPLNPLAPETIIVQSNGMARWLSMQLASQLGVAANLEFPFPAAFLWQTLRKVLGNVPEHLPFDKPVLVWRLFELLPTLEHEAPFLPIHHYIQAEPIQAVPIQAEPIQAEPIQAKSDPSQAELRYYQLSRRIADVYDQYQVYRLDWLLSWERGEQGHWQAELWRRLRLPDAKHRGHWFLEFDKTLRALKPPGLPRRAFVVGISALPPQQMDLFNALAAHMDIHLLILNPSREYWGDIRAERDIARFEALQLSQSAIEELDVHEAEPPDPYLEVGNALLASLGKQGRDFIDLLENYPARDHEQYLDISPRNLLAQIQSDILDLRQRGDKEGERVAPVLEIEADDRSIQVHACHSPMREIEVLHDQLLALFATDPQLRPADIIVMTPDIEAYSPTIEAVFATVEAQRYIPFSIADRSLSHEQPLVEAVLSLLDLPKRRFAAQRILALLEHPALRRRFGLSEADFSLIQSWLRATKIRWGIDSKERAALALPITDEHTWRAGLERLMSGYALPGRENQLWHDILPYGDVEGGNAQVLGRLVTFLESLIRFVRDCEQAHSLSDWRLWLTEQLDVFFLPQDQEETELQQVRSALDMIGATAELANAQAKLGLTVFRKALSDALNDLSSPSGFFSGGVTFCTLVPMRSIPFQVVCLIGMNHDAYPRFQTIPDFDLMSRYFRKGDRSRRNDDRFLFLEALLSARRCFYISYIGNDVRDNSEKPPSVLVSELLDIVARSYYLSDRTPLREQLLTRHPLQAFSRRYFDLDTPQHDPRLFSYSEELANLSRQSGAVRQAERPFLEQALPEPEDYWRQLELSQLLEFFDNPVRYLLRRRLGVLLEHMPGELASTEPFLLDGLEAYDLRQRLLDYQQQGKGLKQSMTLSRAAGLLPHGQIGDSQFRQEWQSVTRFHANLRKSLPSQWLEMIEVDLALAEMRLTGWLDNVSPAGRFAYRPASVKPRDLLRLWLQHLILCQLAPPAINRQSVWVGLDKTVVLEPVADPQFYLQPLLNLYWQGLQQPLPFFAASAYEFLIVLREDRSGKNRRSPERAAQYIWQGSDYHRGESADPYYALVYGERDPLNDDFTRLAQQIWQPVFEHVRNER